LRFLVAIVFVGLIAVGGVFDGTAAARSHRPARQIALGVSSQPWQDISGVDAYKAAVGRYPATWSIWANWGGRNYTFPDTSLLNGLYQRGITPIIFWQPTDPTTTQLGKYAYINIRNGNFDTYIKSWARAAKAWGHPIILRFAHEMDGTWFPWSIHKYGNSAVRFVKAWQHIWTLFHNVGATNVRFMWSPLNPCYCRHSLYPGDKYVNYVGFTALNWGSNRNEWRSLATIVKSRMAKLQKLTSRPVIVAEVASSADGGQSPTSKASWITLGYADVYAQYPQIKALIYFDVDMRADGQPDWRLDNPEDALAAYAQLAALKHFRGRL
jgi:hypothetical protein